MSSLKEDVERLRRERNLKLVGKCIEGCGQCCQGKVKHYRINNENKTVDLIGHGDTDCTCYDPVNKKCLNYSCRIHDLCITFPYLPENLYEGCGFHFEPIVDYQI